MDRRELADFLRRRRAQVAPADVGLGAGLRRRTPGLRREEVARLAAMSVDYYTRLEQARGPRPSRPVLSGIARALRLSEDERAHLFHLAGEAPRAPGPSAEVPAGILHLLDRLDDTPAFVVDAKYDILAWNPLAAALIMDFSRLAPAERNYLRMYFRGPAAEPYGIVREWVADLRAAAAKYPDDPGIAALVADLRAHSAAFGELWADQEVRVRRSMTKHIRHPVVGDIDVECDVLLVPDRDQKVVLYTAVPGTPSHEALRLLKTIGVQDLSTAER